MARAGRRGEGQRKGAEEGGAVGLRTADGNEEEGDGREGGGSHDGMREG